MGMQEKSGAWWDLIEFENSFDLRKSWTVSIRGGNFQMQLPERLSWICEVRTERQVELWQCDSQALAFKAERFKKGVRRDITLGFSLKRRNLAYSSEEFMSYREPLSFEDELKSISNNLRFDDEEWRNLRKIRLQLTSPKQLVCIWWL